MLRTLFWRVSYHASSSTWPPQVLCSHFISFVVSRSLSPAVVHTYALPSRPPLRKNCIQYCREDTKLQVLPFFLPRAAATTPLNRGDRDGTGRDGPRLRGANQRRPSKAERVLRPANQQ